MSLALLEFLDNIVAPDSFMTSWWFLTLMALILIGLVLVLLYMRNKRPEDDD